MYLKRFFIQPRVCFATAVAVAGFIVSLVMVFWGGPTARFLPGVPFHIAAILGAGAAGWLCLGAFGRDGPLGALIAVAASLVMTILGSALGSWGIGVFAGDPVFGAILGPVAVGDAALSPVAVIVWSLCMLALHLYARRLRARAPIPRIRLRKQA